MDIFDRVKMLADRDNISISALEKQLGFSNKSLYPHSKGSTIRGDRVVALSKYFNVSTDWLLSGENYQPLTTNEDTQRLLDYLQFFKKSQKQELLDYADYLSKKGGD